MKGLRSQGKTLAHPTLWLLSLALIVGLIYVFAIPPWQHNDEPGHFEYAWLVAHWDHWPRKGDYDPLCRREIAASMQEIGFYHGYSAPLALVSTPIDIGVSQTGGLPAYYFIASLPLRLFRYTDVTFQLYLTRLVSLILFVLTIYFARLATREIFGEHTLTNLAPLLMILLPGFVNTMTAVNDDVLAVCAITLFLWLAIRVIKHGPHLWETATLLASIGLCMASKQTVWVTLPFGLFAVYLGLLRNHLRVALAALLAAAVILGAAAFSWKETTPANYYADFNQQLPSNPINERAAAGNRVLTIPNKAGKIYQTLDPSALIPIRGKTVEFGGWTWSDSEVNSKHPELISLKSDGLTPPVEMYSSVLSPGGNIQTTESPVFVQFKVKVPMDANSFVLALPSAAVPVHWDCLILIEPDDADTLDMLPQALDPQCSRVEWDGSEYDNLIKNASMENSWPVLRSVFRDKMDRYFGMSITDLWVIFDGTVGTSYFRSVGVNLFQTFWAGFGWGRIPLVGNNPSLIFLALLLPAFFGAMIGIYRRPEKANWNIYIFLILLCLGVGLLALYRGAGNWYHYVFTPVARYLFPVILPIALFLSTGWYVLLKKVLPMFFLYGLFLTAGLAYHCWALYSIWFYFHT